MNRYLLSMSIKILYKPWTDHVLLNQPNLFCKIVLLSWESNSCKCKNIRLYLLSRCIVWCKLIYNIFHNTSCTRKLPHHILHLSILPCERPLIQNYASNHMSTRIPPKNRHYEWMMKLTLFFSILQFPKNVQE